MPSLSAAELLDVWDRGAKSVPVERALLLLSADETAWSEQLGQLSIGQRDARLLELRAQTFGPQLPCLAACPACGEELEWTLNIADLLVGERAHGEAPAAPNDSQTASCGPEPGARISSSARTNPFAPSWSSALPTLNPSPSALCRLELEAYQVTFRLPTCRDLAELSPDVGLSENRQRLLRACVLSSQHHGAEMDASALPSEVADAVARRMAELDPQADIRLKLDCPQCGHAWETEFDILSYFWAEIRGTATRLLSEVHELASAYGWREADILALTPQRRQAYLERVRA